MALLGQQHDEQDSGCLQCERMLRDGGGMAGVLLGYRQEERVTCNLRRVPRCPFSGTRDGAGQCHERDSCRGSGARGDGAAALLWAAHQSLVLHTNPTPGSSTGVLTYKRTSEQALEAAGLPYTIIRCAVLYDAGCVASFCERKQQSSEQALKVSGLPRCAVQDRLVYLC